MREPLRIDKNGYVTLKINIKTALKVIVILALAGGVGFIPIPGLQPAARICLMIFVGAAGLWITEAIPPFATAIMVIVLNIYLLGTPGGPLQLERTGLDTSYQIFLNPIASPVLVLFFGGFILAIAATKHGLDVRLARAFIKPFGTEPRMVLLGIILTTALFSMFMSNTATTAMMIAILSPLFKHFEGRGPFKRAMVLSVPFAANIGGMGTIIGTPPNAVAASVLSELGNPVSFLRWMLIGVPLVIILLFALWLILITVFRPREERFEILFPEPIEKSWDLLLVVCTFTITVLMWLSEPLHGIPTAVVALLPVMVFTMFGIIDRHDIKKLDWDVLILVAGGLTLGVSMKRTGLSDFLVDQISFMPVPPMVLLCIIAVFSLLIANFMSHTSAANLIIPIATSLAVFSPVIAAIAVAFSTSLAMSLPISTPPNAIAFATRSVSTKEMARYGTLISIIGMPLMLAALAFLHYVLKLI